jgi:hypothetical protein
MRCSRGRSQRQPDDARRAALDHLQQNHPDAYGALADMAETHSESLVIEHDGQPYDALLVAVPVLAWTRYMIPSGPLKGDRRCTACAPASACSQAARGRLAPFLYSIDQLRGTTSKRTGSRSCSRMRRSGSTPPS